MSSSISLAQLSRIDVSYDSLTDNTATITITGHGPAKPEPTTGFQNTIEFVQDDTTPLKFYVSYLPETPESDAPPALDTWQSKKTFQAALGDGAHQTVAVTVVFFSTETGGELSLTLAGVFLGGTVSEGDPSDAPF